MGNTEILRTIAIPEPTNVWSKPPMSVSTDTFYSSSNGDRWQLLHDDETGRYVVRHEPNLSSGGQPSEVAVPIFLNRSGTSPQAEALRTLLHKQGVADAEDE
jgi:hypothetical protein